MYRLSFAFVVCAYFLTLLPVVSAATLHGTVYDLELSKAEGAVVEVNSNPKQVVVAADGAFAFQLVAGTYFIFARHKTRGTSNETIIIPTDGVFVRDIILFPEELDESLVQEPMLDFPDSSEAQSFFGWGWVIWVIAVVAFGFGVVGLVRLRKKVIVPLDDTLSQVVSFIRKEGGRASQKDIRKALSPLSEAKISLIITELEQQGKLAKIKRGRGNIIILK